MTSPICDYCHQPTKLVSGEVIYPHRPDLASKSFYICKPCKAYVGCHRGTNSPLGRVANAELRKAKSAAHRAFDPFWRKGRMKRGAAYAKLGDEMGIPREEVHIGMMDVGRCKLVVEICRGWAK